MRRSLMRRFVFALIPAATLVFAASLALPCAGQDSDFNLDVHANSHTTAAEIGLPVYPGATPYKESDSDSSAADLGIAFNAFHFGVQAMSFETPDSPDQVLRFYKKRLAIYGEVLQCSKGQAVGTLKTTKSGLTCGSEKNGGVSANGSDDEDELRAGTPQQFRIVAINGRDAGKTKFGLVALVLPKDSN
jgi:hypothetical protein